MDRTQDLIITVPADVFAQCWVISWHSADYKARQIPSKILWLSIIFSQFLIDTMISLKRAYKAFTEYCGSFSVLKSHIDIGVISGKSVAWCLHSTPSIFFHAWLEACGVFSVLHVCWKYHNFYVLNICWIFFMMNNYLFLESDIFTSNEEA